MTSRERQLPVAFSTLVLAIDLLLINGSFLATSLLKFSSWYPPGEFAPIYVRLQVGLNLVFMACLTLAGAYRDVWRSSLGHQTVTAFKACLWGVAATAGWQFLERNEGYSRFYVTFLLTQVAILIPFSRILLVRLNEVAHQRGLGVRPVLVVGEREPLRDLALLLRLAPQLGYRVEALLPLDFEVDEAGGRSPRVVKDRADLADLLASGTIDRVFLCGYASDRDSWKQVVDVAEELGVETRLVRWPLLVPDFRARIHDLLTVPVVPEGVEVVCRGSRAVAKRVIDILGASAALLALSPFFLAAAVAIRLDSPGPVLYGQTRLGRGGRRFQILKFRSMHSLADEERARLKGANEATGPLFKMRHDPRVTRVGAVLRRFSLDELPQLINVVRGDLSLVGPRPPLPEEAEAYEPWQRHRLDVDQGMTGLWQVSGRSRLTFDEMALLDLHYIENWSLLLDIEILMETLPTILHGDGAY